MIPLKFDNQFLFSLLLRLREDSLNDLKFVKRIVDISIDYQSFKCALHIIEIFLLKKKSQNISNFLPILKKLKEMPYDYL